MTAAATFPGFLSVFAPRSARSSRPANPTHDVTQADEADAVRARREFILAMMDDCPEAFATEEGVRGTMHYFSGRY